MASATITAAQEYIPDPAWTGAGVCPFIASGTPVTLVCRNILYEAPVGAYVEWQVFPVGGSLTENRITNLDCQNEYEGELTSALAAPAVGYGWIAPTTATAVVYNVTRGTSPYAMGIGSTSFTLVNHDESLSGAVNTYVRWKKILLSNGKVENRVTWIGC